jgi:hypothetical protein
MDSNQEKMHACPENALFSAEPVLSTGDALLQRAQQVSQKIEERIRNILRDDDHSLQPD